ncbi:hypothetical protein MRX96_013722 [Rhipicephalus microplus]
MGDYDEAVHIGRCGRIHKALRRPVKPRTAGAAPVGCHGWWSLALWQRKRPDISIWCSTPSLGFRLYWTVDYEAESLTAELKLDLPSDDWFTIGFSDRGDITLADVCVLWADPHGRPHLEDGWTDDAGYVTVDEQNDCILGSLKRKGSTLRFLFTRKFDTCDSHDYVIRSSPSLASSHLRTVAQDGTVHLVYATGKGPLRRLEGLRLTRTQHGFQRAQLLKVMEDPPPFPSDTKFANFLNDKTKKRRTGVRLLKLPSDFSYKKHIVRYEANIQKGSEALVHHMELFHCEAPD